MLPLLVVLAFVFLLALLAFYSLADHRCVVCGEELGHPLHFKCRYWPFCGGIHHAYRVSVWPAAIIAGAMLADVAAYLVVVR